MLKRFGRLGAIVRNLFGEIMVAAIRSQIYTISMGLRKWNLASKFLMIRALHQSPVITELVSIGAILISVKFVFEADARKPIPL